MPQVLNFKLDVFDGPLDLLLTLINKQKIDIYDIPIAEILDQYLEYMELAQNYDAELSSEFIVMACELLYIKSRMLLPSEEEEEDPRSELVKALIEYSEVKATAEYLAGRAVSYFKRYPPVPREPVVKVEVPATDPSALWECFCELRLAVREERERRKKEDVQKIFSVRVAPVESKVVFVLRRLVRSLPLGNSVSFSSMIREQGSKSDRVATFLAILELVQSGRIRFQRTDADYVISLNSNKKKERAKA